MNQNEINLYRVNSLIEFEQSIYIRGLIFILYTKYNDNYYLFILINFFISTEFDLFLILFDYSFWIHQFDCFSLVYFKLCIALIFKN